ncbi:hypothetical protein FPOA_12679 [Fusarium poae]|uniref:HTH CENPB-type domain-containing protein n=1 Tax=Fusarium poae TaxID=36050 RepID=A0A1B8A8E1_FUSPO|nr:hypothetical protein FPOA_12679 [Fusarium poae]
MLRSRLRWKYTEDDVAEAILDVTDNGFSPPQAAHRRGVPRRTLIDRLHGRGAVKEQIHPHRRLSKRQEDRLAFWILRQESLGYAPSHSQIRACVMGLLRQQGEHPNLGRNWVIKFINRRADLKTKMGRRQEAKRFDSFTPKAVHWYFDIRDGQYGWIKPENTVNVDEGGLDSLVVGSADPKRKAFLKGPQTRNWTSFIEAVTADGRALVPGIIFKGKELQKQWFLEEFKQIADWYYITSPNGWTDDHIGIEWLERVYLPQTTPADESDARLIILDGHGTHATPLDNGVFNALKAAYRRELERFASLTDSAPMDKVNFIRAYAKARRVGMTKKNILSGWRVTGNWPISRAKALRHPEIQQDRPNGSPRVTPEPRPYLGSDDTPQTSRQIRDLGLNKTPKTRRRYNVIAKGFEAHQQTVAAHTQRIASLEEELARLKRGKKRKAVPNPNKRFMTLGETLAGKESIPEGATRYTPIGVEFISSSEQESASEAGSVIENKLLSMSRKRTRSIPEVDQEIARSDEEGETIDDTPKASSRGWKKKVTDLSRGSTPSLASSSAASGASSPTKQIRYAATQDAGFVTVPFVDNIQRLPPSLKKIRQELVDIGYGAAMLPQSLREELQSLGDFPSFAFYDPATRSSQWRIPPSSLVRQLVTRAAECQRYNEGESSWNNDIHDGILRWVFRETDDVAMFDYRYCTGAQLIHEYRPIGTSSKSVDFCVCIKPPESSIEGQKITKAIGTRPGISISHTEWGNFCRHPIALSIETKRQAEWEKALLQIATWHSAQWRALQFKTRVESIEFLAGVVVQGHSWYFVASTLEGGVSTLYHRITLGSTENHFDLFKLLIALQCLGSWIKDKYWPAFRADILRLPATEQEGQ